MLHELGALPDEPMAAPSKWIVDGTGDGKDLPARLAGQPGGDQGPRSLCRFYYDQADLAALTATQAAEMADRLRYAHGAGVDDGRLATDSRAADAAC